MDFKVLRKALHTAAIGLKDLAFLTECPRRITQRIALGLIGRRASSPEMRIRNVSMALQSRGLHVAYLSYEQHCLIAPRDLSSGHDNAGGSRDVGETRDPLYVD